MPKLSLTDFVGVVSSSGTPKTTKVRQIKNRSDYHPAKDYYKQVRDGIVAVHRSGAPKTRLDGYIGKAIDVKKIDNFNAVVLGYKRWWGRKKFVWFGPSDAIYSAHGIDINVKPELGLKIGGAYHLVKLYFNNAPLAKNRADIITHLMELSLGPLSPKGTVMMVVDCRRAKEFSYTKGAVALKPTIDAELAYIAAIWPSV